MNPITSSEDFPGWLPLALDAHFIHQSAGETPSPDFDARCQTAAQSALDLLKMQASRGQLAMKPGSLSEHLQAVAQLAGVELKSLLGALGIAVPELPVAGRIHRLARVAALLGIDRKEALLRLRWGFAEAIDAVTAADWPLRPALAVRRQARGAGDFNQKQKGGDVNTALRRAEAKYTAAQRAELRAATNSLAEAYAQDSE